MSRQWSIYVAERHLTDRAILTGVAAFVLWKRAGFAVHDVTERARVWHNATRLGRRP